MSRWSSPVFLAVFLTWGCSSAGKKAPTGALDRAQALYRQGEFEKAAAECTKAITAGEQPAQAHLLRGKCKEKIGADDAAVADFKQARTLDPKVVEAYCREARVLARRTQTGAAMEVFQAAQAIKESLSGKDRFYLEATLGEVYIAAGQANQARQTLKTAIEISSRARLKDTMPVAVAYHNLSRAHFQMASFRSARQAYQQYLDLKGRAGGEITPQDRFTEVVLRLLTGDLRGAQEIAQGLPADLRKEADALLTGDALSVKALIEAGKGTRR